MVFPRSKIRRCWSGSPRFSDRCSLFPTASVIEEFKNELKDFITSKGTIQFPLEKPLPIALIKKLVKARVARSGNKKPDRKSIGG